MVRREAPHVCYVLVGDCPPCDLSLSSLLTTTRTLCPRAKGWQDVLRSPLWSYCQRSCPRLLHWMPCFFPFLRQSAGGGARPLLHKAQILHTQPAAGTPPVGMPPYVIIGVAMAPDDPQDPRFELQLIMTAVLDAVESFNAAHPEAIQVIGLWAGHLCVDRLEPEQVGKIIQSVYHKMSPC